MPHQGGGLAPSPLSPGGEIPLTTQIIHLPTGGVCPHRGRSFHSPLGESFPTGGDYSTPHQGRSFHSPPREIIPLPTGGASQPTGEIVAWAMMSAVGGGETPWSICCSPDLSCETRLCSGGLSVRTLGCCWAAKATTSGRYGAGKGYRGGGKHFTFLFKKRRS